MGNTKESYPRTVLNERLTEMMKQRGLTITRLADEADLSVGTIQKVMTDPHCNPTIGCLEAICKVLNITISELVGEDEKLHALFGKTVPIIEWEDIPIKAETTPKQIGLYAIKEFVKTNCQVSDETFAVKMKDDSMLPVFRPGSILIFDSKKNFYNGAYVLVKLQGYDTVVFKQLYVDEPNTYIRSINNLFKENLIQLKKTDKIIATLVESQVQY